MLLKLIKFKLRSFKTPFIVTSACMLGLMLIISLTFNSMITMIYKSLDGVGEFDVLSLMFIILPLLFISALGFAAAIFVAYFFSAYSVFEVYGKDVSYLYFTLPLDRRDILKATVFSAIIQMLMIYLVSFICGVVFIVSVIFNPTMLELEAKLQDELILTILGDLFSELFDLLVQPEIITNMVVSFLNSICSVIYMAVFVSLVCIYGCSFAKKHKFVSCLITAFVAALAVGIVNIMINFFFTIVLSAVFESNPTAVSISTGVVNMLYTVGLTFLAYILAKQRLTKGLDIT